MASCYSACADFYEEFSGVHIDVTNNSSGLLDPQYLTQSMTLYYPAVLNGYFNHSNLMSINIRIAMLSSGECKAYSTAELLSQYQAWFKSYKENKEKLDTIKKLQREVQEKFY